MKVELKNAISPLGFAAFGATPGIPISSGPQPAGTADPYVSSGVIDRNTGEITSYPSDASGYMARVPTYLWAISAASMALSAYHGYKRNNSVGWALVWGLLGSVFPIITPTIALAEGFGQPKK